MNAGTSVILIGVLFSLIAQAGGATSPLPVSPVDPTWEQCAIMEVQFSQEIMASGAALRECHTQGPSFGWGATCSGTPRPTAFVHCEPILHAQCSLRETRDREMATCRERARNRAERERVDARRRREQEEALRRINDNFERLSRNHTTFTEIISNPTQFFFDQAVASVTRSVFPTWEAPQAMMADPRAEELFRSIHNAVHSGAVTSRNPVVGAIQREAFDALLRHYRRLDLEAARAFTAISEFVVSEQNQFMAINPIYLDEDDFHDPDPEVCHLIGTC